MKIKKEKKALLVYSLTLKISSKENTYSKKETR